MAEDKRWLQMLKLLTFFYENTGRWPEPGERIDGRDIGGWLAHQRKQFYMGRYSEERVELLRGIGFVFDARVESNWDSYYKLLSDFLDEFVRYPDKGEKYKGVGLGDWFHVQLSLVGKPDYSVLKRKKLRELGVFTGSLREAAWERNFGYLVQFCKENGRLPWMTEKPFGICLRAWLNRTLDSTFGSPYAILCKRRVWAFLYQYSLMNDLGYQNGPWTEKEDTVLREWYFTEGSACAYRIFGRSERECRGRAAMLGLTTEAVCLESSGARWTAAEDAVLEQWYPIEGQAVASRLSARSKAACSARASALGLCVAKR